MTDKTEQKAPEQNEPEAPQTTTEDMVPASRLNNLIDQIKYLKSELAEHSKAKSEVEAQRKADEERKLIEAQKFEEVLGQRSAENETLKAQLAQLQTDLKRGNVERALMGAGVSGDNARRGLLAKFFEDSPEDLTAWVEEQKRAYPSDFAPAKTPMSSGPVGHVKTGDAGADLATRLTSKDPKIKQAALSEELSKILSGQLAPGWRNS